MKLSIVTAAFNEEKSIGPLFRGIKEALRREDFEVVAVDDGSDDGTWLEMQKEKDGRFRAVSLGEHRGKCAALYKGFGMAKGEIIATLDSDLQCEPNDIKGMVKMLNSGLDMVCGFRFERKDGFGKRASAKAANLAGRLFFGIGLRDIDCPARVFRRQCVENIAYFEHMHRFIPVMAKLQGFKVGEMKVRHYPRAFGKSNYGIRNRLWANIRTACKVKFCLKRLLKKA